MERVNGEAGKGDTYRPVNKKVFDRNFDLIFGKKRKPSKKKKNRV